MIISASRRTDIPAFYADWLLTRIREGYVFVRNPMQPRKISRVSLSPDVVDGLVLWTKNPLPMLGRLRELQDYMYYFQFTLNPYGPEVEPRVPSKQHTLIPAFQRLAETLGPDRVIWRYDPIFLSETYSEAYHLHYFEVLARRLAPYTRRCTISFIDYYRGTEKAMRGVAAKPLTPPALLRLARGLADIARAYGLSLDTCAEEADLSAFGIGHARCVDGALLSRLLGTELRVSKDKNQRPACGCAESIDIGAYHSCPHGCLYCYAGGHGPAAKKNHARHNPASPLLIGEVGPEDQVTERAVESLKVTQLSLS